MSDEYDDDERPSWREIDKKRDRSSHVRQERTEKGAKPGVDRWNVGRQKKALDQLFKGDKGTIEHEKLYSRIHKSYGTEKFLPTVQRYIEKYGPPDDASTLFLVIDTKEKDLVLLAMEKLRAIYREVSNREKEDIRRKLSIIAMTERAVDIKERAGEVLEELKSSAS